MKVALYLRVSTREQIENYSLPNQEDRLRSFCKAKEWEVHDVYKDGGHSGADMDRPDLQRMLNDIKQHKINAVMVYKLDRLSRSQRDTLELIEDHFLKNDVDFISVTETLDTTTPMGRAMIGIMSAFAQLEREMIAERMRDGQIRRAQAGYAAMGGDYDPAGFKRKNGELITKDDEKKHIQDAFKLYKQYHSITKVQHELKLLGHPVWRFRRYRDILENPIYNGKVTFAGKVYEGRQEKFIDDDLFNTVQELLKRHRGHNFHRAKESLLAGMISCKKCGERYLTYQTKDGRYNRVYRYYICKARRFPSEFPEKCMNKNWNTEKLEELINNELQLINADLERTEQKKDPIDFTKLINNVDQKIDRVIDLYTNMNIEKDVLDRQIDKLNHEKKELIERKKAQDHEPSYLSFELMNDYVIDLKQADFKTKRAIVEKLISQIYIDDDDVSIEWNF